MDFFTGIFASLDEHLSVSVDENILIFNKDVNYNDRNVTCNKLYAFGMIFKFCEIGQRMTDAFDDFYVLMG